MEFAIIAGYSGLAGLATISGTLLVFFNRRSQEYAIHFISFAAGVMLATAFVHLVPKSTELYPHAAVMVLLGMLTFYVVQNIMTLHPCHDEECEIHRLGMLALVGLTLHSLLDGVVIAVGFETSTRLGLVTTLAVILHELPEGISTTGILLYSNEKRSRVLIYSIIVAIATPAGAMISYLLLRGISEHVLGALIALAAGSFIYIAAADLIPETHKSQSKVSAGLLIAGVLVLGVIGHLLE